MPIVEGLKEPMPGSGAAAGDSVISSVARSCAGDEPTDEEDTAASEDLTLRMGRLTKFIGAFHQKFPTVSLTSLKTQLAWHRDKSLWLACHIANKVNTVVYITPLNPNYNFSHKLDSLLHLFLFFTRQCIEAQLAIFGLLPIWTPKRDKHEFDNVFKKFFIKLEVLQRCQENFHNFIFHLTDPIHPTKIRDDVAGYLSKLTRIRYYLITIQDDLISKSKSLLFLSGAYRLPKASCLDKKVFLSRLGTGKPMVKEATQDSFQVSFRNEDSITFQLQTTAKQIGQIIAVIVKQNSLPISTKEITEFVRLSEQASSMAIGLPGSERERKRLMLVGKVKSLMALHPIFASQKVSSLFSISSFARHKRLLLLSGEKHTKLKQQADETFDYQLGEAEWMFLTQLRTFQTMTAQSDLVTTMLTKSDEVSDDAAEFLHFQYA